MKSKRLMRISGTLITAAMLSACSPSEDMQATGGSTVDLGTHALHAVIRGHGTPVLVIDGGLSAMGSEYSELQDSLSVFTTVVTYDRAGYGESQAGPLPRDSRSEVEELRAMLSGLDLQPPYLLLGHSLGGLNMEVYAYLYPEEVAGMVLLDPPPMGYLEGNDYQQFAQLSMEIVEEWQSIADRGRDSDDPDDRRRADFFRMMASEQREMTVSSADVASRIESFGDIPLVVIASEVANPAFGDTAEAYQEYWIRQSRIVSGMSSRGQFQLARGCTHMLHLEAQELVRDAVLTILRETEGTGGY